MLRYDESSKVVVTFLVMAVFKSLCGCVFSFCFRGVTQLNSSNPIGSASKTARFGASVFCFCQRVNKGQHLVLR